MIGFIVEVRFSIIKYKAVASNVLDYQNGPIRIEPDYSASANPYSWNQLADTIWVDQPV